MTARGPYAFHANSAACTGCKACQAACKDHNGLPVGVLWRRVYEVSGGGWWRDGAAWRQDVFAYSLSVSCNHCEHPICAEVCPTGACHEGPGGLVLMDSDRCMGCHYCSWACPYGAPQFDGARGVMTKCTACIDRLDAGLPPSCVAACPMRALDFGPREDMEARYGEASGYPLPDPSTTLPGLRVTGHPQAGRARSQGRVANGEEVGRP